MLSGRAPETSRIHSCMPCLVDRQHGLDAAVACQLLQRLYSSRVNSASRVQVHAHRLSVSTKVPSNLAKLQRVVFTYWSSRDRSCTLKLGRDAYACGNLVTVIVEYISIEREHLVENTNFVKIHANYNKNYLNS
jgi:hypothetical protein